MRVSLTEYDLKTLKQDDDGLWTYRLKTRTGDVVGSGIKTKEEAISHAEKNVTSILRKILNK
jgi:hypothetical protein